MGIEDVRELDAFQLYLLSKMSARDLVDQALARLGVTQERMMRAASEIACVYGLDEPFHSADAYEKLAGPAVLTRELGALEVGDSLRGSIRRCYSLPLWPNVYYVVNRHPSGYAWDARFQQGERRISEPDPCALAMRVKPWAFAGDVLMSAANKTEFLDAWTDFVEARLTFASPRGSSAVFYARFDVGLLQRWERDVSALH
jgi:hypothetical protein